VDLSDRNKRKHMDKAVELLRGDGSRPIDYVMGGGGALPSNLLLGLVLLGAIGLSVAIYAATGTVTFIGGLVLVAVYFGLNQPRGVLLTDRGVASFRCGFLNGRPTDFVGGDHVQVLQQATERKAGARRVRIAGDQVWIKDKDADRFLAATPSA
jgi:hypothetical protein